MLRVDPATLWSAGLVLGRPLEFLPTAPVGWLAQRIVEAVVRRHPDISERLSGLSGKRLMLDPCDLPLAFVLELTDRAPRVEVVAQDHDPGLPIHATVRGSVAQLISLVEGRVDADALFFSRRLSIDGDTELVVAIRNAMDGSAIDLRELLLGSVGGPLRPLGLRLMRGLAYGHARLEAELSLLAGAMAGPLRAELAQQAVALRRLQQEVQEMRRLHRRARSPDDEKREAQ